MSEPDAPPCPFVPRLTHVLLHPCCQAGTHIEGSFCWGQIKGTPDVQGSTINSQSWCRGETDADGGAAPWPGFCPAL